MCHQEATCIDADGSYTCSCKSGYIGDGQICNSKQVSVYVTICLHRSLEMNKCNTLARIVCALLLSTPGTILCVVFSQTLMSVQWALICAIKRQLVQILMEIILVHATVDILEMD